MGAVNQVQSSIGFSDYLRRDLALKNLIQPLAGEYGMHNGEPQGGASSWPMQEFHEDNHALTAEEHF